MWDSHCARCWGYCLLECNVVYVCLRVLLKYWEHCTKHPKSLWLYLRFCIVSYRHASPQNWWLGIHDKIIVHPWLVAPKGRTFKNVDVLVGSVSKPFVINGRISLKGLWTIKKPTCQICAHRLNNAATFWIRKNTADNSASMFDLYSVNRNSVLKPTGQNNASPLWMF